jgi:hypothetical protein
MTPEQVLDHPALVLDQRARKRYFVVDQAPARPAP